MKLRAFERRWLRLVFETILPSTAHPRVTLGARDVPLDAFVDDLLDSGAPRFLLGLRVSLWVIALAPLALGRFRTFAGLAPDERVALLDRVRRNRVYLIRETVNVLKMAACLGYCGLPSVRAQIGIAPVGERPPAWVPAARSESESGAA